jgi:hypothetical protein
MAEVNDHTYSDIRSTLDPLGEYVDIRGLRGKRKYFGAE